MFGVQTLDDGAALLADLDRAQPRRAVVVGGGYIGVEMAEALVRRGVAVTVVDQAAQRQAAPARINPPHEGTLMAGSGGTAVTVPRGAECSPPCGRLQRSSAR